MPDLRFAAAGGNQAKVALKFAMWQITGGAYGLWVDFQPYTPDGAAGVQWMWASAATSITNATTVTARYADSNLTFDSGFAITAGAAAAAPATDAPRIGCSATSSAGWVRGVWVPPTRVLQVWHATANLDLSIGFRMIEVRVGDRGQFLFGGRFTV